uniref:Transposase n=1 Tax=Plectus sambesii TaxID=2011161 RepID=A0A914UUB6_9BILA
MVFSEREQIEVWGMMTAGLSATRIWELRGDRPWVYQSIWRLCQRLRANNGAVGRKRGSGRPRAARTEEIVAQVRTRLRSPPRRLGSHLSHRKTAQAIGISRRTVQRIAKELGLRSFRKIKTHRLTPAHEADEHKIVFTDEKYFELHAPAITQNQRVNMSGRKRDVSTRRLVIQRNRFSRKVMVWAGISWRGKAALHFFEPNERMNGATYRQLLVDEILPSCRDLCPDGSFVFQQDSARPHNANDTIALLNDHAPGFITPQQWPASSPDLNPCDYRLWAYLQTKVYAEGSPATLDELVLKIRDAWEALPVRLIRTWINEWKQRLRKCVRNQGKHIQQYFNKI